MSRAVPIVRGDLVIIEHPHIRDEAVVARVETDPTKSMCDVTYYGSQGWHPTPKRRNKLGVIGVLKPGADPAAVTARLVSASARKRDSERRALETWRAAVQGELQPVAGQGGA